MAGYRATQIRKPANETEFEKNCVDLFREILGDPNVKRFGTRGQRQDGVDIVGHREPKTKTTRWRSMQAEIRPKQTDKKGSANRSSGRIEIQTAT